jgi:hypothetical protein
MGKKSLLAIMASTVAVVGIGAGPALAAPPQAVTFTVDEVFEPPSGVFTSDGSVVCASGTTSNNTFASAVRSPNGLIFHVRKTITCDDGSGTFTLQLQARIGFNVGDNTFGPWVVLGGTGAYENLHGQGTVVGTQLGPGVHDAYTGWLSNP